MKKRTFNRISLSTDVPARLLHNGDVYEGIVANISNKGMYIESETPLPIDARFLKLHPFKYKFELLIPMKENDLKISVKLKRLIQKDDWQGIGVEVNHPEMDYLEFVETLRTYPESVHNSSYLS